MLEFEENKKNLSTLKQKVLELGESLWHIKFRRRTKKPRKTNIRRRILVR